jgi:hypothetical protein
VRTYWNYVSNDLKTEYKHQTRKLKVFEDNSKKIKQDNLGGPNSPASKQYTKDLNYVKELFAESWKSKDVYVKDQIKKSDKLDDLLKKTDKPMTDLFKNGTLLCKQKGAIDNNRWV